MDVVLFHHALGQTPGFLGFGDDLRAADHAVTTPDLYDQRVFADLDEGVAFADRMGTAEFIGRAMRAVADLPPRVVYAGFSLGSVAAQALTQGRPGAAGALLYHGGAAPRWFPQPWPPEVPVQIHTSENDPWVDVEECRELAADASRAEVYIYPGSAHLFADPDSGEYEAAAAGLLLERSLEFLATLG